MPPFTLCWAAELFAHPLRVPLQRVDLLLLVEHHVGSEHLAGQQQTCQRGQACHLKGTAVGAPEREREKNMRHFRRIKQQGRGDKECGGERIT